jgi:hypothetical protein
MSAITYHYYNISGAPLTTTNYFFNIAGEIRSSTQIPELEAYVSSGQLDKAIYKDSRIMNNTDPGYNLTTPVALSGTYTISENDDQGVRFAAGGTIVTVPPLTNMPEVIFVPTTGNSITLRPTGGVLIDGSSSDVVKSVLTDPAGFVLVPSLVLANVYSTSLGAITFSNIGGTWSDHTALATAMAAKAALADCGYGGSSKLNTNIIVGNADNGKYFYSVSTAGGRAITVPAGLQTNFGFFVARHAAATSNVTVIAGSSVTFISSVAGASTLTLATAAANTFLEVRYTGLTDTYLVISNSIT